MKHLLALLFLLCPLRDAYALTIANAQDYADIAKILQTANEKEADIAANATARAKAKRKKDLGTVARLDNAIAVLKKESKDAHEQAMWLTMRAFDIIPFADNVPILDEGVSVLRSPEKGTPIRWLPVFEDTVEKPLQDENGDPDGDRNANPDVVGNTASDGISRIFPGAFSSPEMLASVIIHEKRHFKQNTTAGKGDKKTTAELEVEAYEEEWRLMKVLGFSGENERSQKARLTEILNGKKGEKGQKDVKGKRELAREERAAVDKFNGGRPFPESSYVSHSTVEIDALINQAKDQIVIAQRDHDDRLRNTIKRLTQRSCANPGSVSQAELIALPRPHRADYWMSNGPGHCHDVYAYLAQGGTDAEYLRRMSTPLVPIMPNPQPAQPAPVSPIAIPRFSSIFPQLKEFAVAACLGLKQPQPIYPLYGRYAFYDTVQDADLARNLTAGLDNCSRQLFYKVIDKTRDSGGNFELTSKWVQEMVAALSPGTGTSPGYVDPSPAPPSRGRRCEDFGVINCPKNLLQVKL